jgi:hypothetical protein
MIFFFLKYYFLKILLSYENNHNIKILTQLINMKIF